MRSIGFVVALGCVHAASAQCCQSRYVVLGESLAWYDARAQADLLGGFLVCLGSAEDEQFVGSMLPNGQTYWIGYSDAETEGEWLWLTGEPTMYTNWQEGEPNNFTGDHPNGEDVAYAAKAITKGWNDVYAGGALQRRVVVEFPPEQPTPDLNNDGYVNGQDLALVLGFWGECASPFCAGDANHDEVVDGLDLAIVLGGWTG